MSNKCDLCNLCGFSNPSCIWGTGPKKADIMIINASAGDKDEESGEATMEGIVRRTLENCDYDLDKVYYTNAIKCRTPKGYKIKVSEIKKCRDYLQEEIKKVKPKYVLLLGAQACQAALDMKMSELQGTPYKKDGITYYSTYSPRVLYYDAAKAPQVERELRSFLELTKGNKVNKKGKLNTILLTSLEEVKEAFKDYKKKYKSISYDIESTGLDRFEDDITLFGFGNNKVQYQIPLMVKYSPLEFKPIARKVMMQYAIKQIQTFRWQIAANGKFDDLFLEYHYGLKPFCNFDTNMASHLLDENTPDGLKDSAIRELGAPNWDINTTMKKGTVETKEQFKEFCKYNGYDIYYTHKLFLHYKKLLENDPALYKLQHYLMCPAGRAYERIEKKGIYINPKAYNKSKTELYAERDRIEKELHDLIPDKKLRKKYKDINWNSVDQVSNLLFKDMGMTPLDRTPTGKPQINESVLKRLNHPICDKLIEHRGVATAIGTFVDGWGKLIKEDGRVHTKFNLIGTVTGRTSSNSPNLQQLPRDTSIRCWVDAPEGYTFVTADYSQLELRMAAVVSGDRRMTQLFFEGADIHMNTAMSITGKQPEDIEKEERKKAKSCFTGETEVLTPKGWCRLDEYNGDDVAQYNMNSGEITFTQPIHYDRVRSGSVYTFEDRNISLSLTSDHNILFKTRSGLLYKDEAIKFQDKSGYMISAGNYEVKDYKLSEIETRLLALIVSDSNYVSPGIWRFGFTKKRKIERFKKLMFESHIEFETYENSGITKFVINNWDLYTKIIRYCGPDKVLSWDCINEIDGKVYLEEASYWDGHQGFDNTKYVSFTTTKKQTAEVMQVMGTLNGMRVTLKRKTHKGVNHSDSYRLTYRLKSKTDSRVNIHFEQKLGVHWTYCLQVPEGNIVIRHNNKVSIQGNCNFGFLYGMQWKKFMIYARDNYGTVVNEKEAKAFRNSFFDEYSDLLPWHDKQRRLARAEGEVRNPIGRIRHLPGIYSLEKSKQAEAERQAINSPVQGFGSDVAISAIVELVNTVPEEIGYLVGSVHDSIECLVKTEYVEWFSKYVLKTMSNPRILKEIFQFETKVPIIADLEVGPFGLGVELEEWMKTNKVPQKEGWLIDWNPKNVLPPRYKKRK